MREAGINYGDVRNAADDIRNFARLVRDAANTLQETAENCIKSGVRVEWATILLEKLNTYRENDIEEGLSDMIKQADKIVEMSDNYQAYETEQM